MVNSPSRPNVRPVDPPSLGASVRPAFALPHPGPRLRAGRGQFEISNLRFEIPLLLVAIRKDHQGRIKAKTPAIVPNQGKSRQTPNFQTAVRSANHPLDGANRQTNDKTCAKEKSSPGGEDTGEGEHHHQSSPRLRPRRQSRQKTPAIKPHQGLSRQTMKKPNTTIPSANGAAPYQPKATPWVCSLGTPALKGRLIPPIKAKTPLIVPNQGSSRQTPNFQTAVRSANHPLDWADRQTNGETLTKEKSSPGGRGHRLGRASSPINPRSPPVANQGKNPSNQSKSSLIKAEPQIPGARPSPGAATTKPCSRIVMPKATATPTPRKPIPVFPLPSSLYQGKNPFNRA